MRRKLTVEKKVTALGGEGFVRRRYMVLKGRCFSLYRPALNLSQEEYDRRLEEIKKMGNIS